MATRHIARRLLALVVVVAGVVAFRHARTATPAPPARDPVPAAVVRLPAATATVDSAARQLTIELPAIDVAAGGMVITPLYRVAAPVSASLYRFRVDIVDSTGAVARGVYLHHFNLTDPSRRELFLPISLHMLAASKETPPVDVPRLVFGMPLERGRPLMASGMVVNEGHAAARVRVRLVLHYITPGTWPLFRVFPWVMDVMFPLGAPPHGSKAFDLPPGKSERSWDARPAIAGTMLGVGGHIHDYGTDVLLTDVTTGTVLWHGLPEREASGRVDRLPVERFYRWYRLGVRVDPTHVYRITVRYDNPTGRTICGGGMGAVAGLFVPDGGAVWPSVDTTDAVYRQDLEDTLEPKGDPMMMAHACR